MHWIQIHTQERTLWFVIFFSFFYCVFPIDSSPSLLRHDTFSRAFGSSVCWRAKDLSERKFTILIFFHVALLTGFFLSKFNINCEWSGGRGGPGLRHIRIYYFEMLVLDCWLLSLFLLQEISLDVPAKKKVLSKQDRDKVEKYERKVSLRVDEIRVEQGIFVAFLWFISNST